jgi:hypothetical protein
MKTILSGVIVAAMIAGAGVARAEQTVLVPVPDDVRAGGQMMVISGVALTPSRVAYGADLGVDWRLLGKLSAPVGIGYDDLMSMDAGFGWLTTTQLADAQGKEGKFSFSFSAGYDGTVGYRAERWSVHGGLRLQFVALVVGGASGYAGVYPLVVRAAFKPSPSFGVSGAAWASAFGATKALGADANLHLGEHFRINAAFNQFRNLELSSAFFADTSGSGSTLTVSAVYVR